MNVREVFRRCGVGGCSEHTIPLSVLRAVVAHRGVVLSLIEAAPSVRVALGRHPLLHLR